MQHSANASIFVLYFATHMRRLSKNKRTPSSQGPRGRKVTVTENSTLLPFLFQLLSQQSKTSVKALLSKRQIYVNGTVTTQFNTPLVPGDEVLVSHERGKAVFNNPLLNIIWEDNYLIVVNKKEGLLSVPNTRVKERTAFSLLSDYVRKSDPRNKIFILHRLDRDTSGLMIFAKTIGVQKKMQENWNEVITQRSYVAVVEGRPEKDVDLITSNLTENSNMQVLVASTGEGKEAITRYRVVRSNGSYSLLDLDLETGRKNQIRVQMQSIGHPIAGDNKYGAETDPAGRLLLHARKICFIHPETGEELKFETHTPDVFNSLTKKS